MLNGSYKTKSPAIDGQQSNLWNLNQDGHEKYYCSNLSFSVDGYGDKYDHSWARIGNLWHPHPSGATRTISSANHKPTIKNNIFIQLCNSV